MKPELKITVDDDTFDMYLVAELQQYRTVLLESLKDDTLNGYDKGDAAATVAAIEQVLSHYMLQEDYIEWMKTKS